LSNKNVATKRPIRTEKIELKKRRRRTRRRKGVNTYIPTRCVHVEIEKKEKEERVLKYFQVENNIMSFMELKGRR